MTRQAGDAPWGSYVVDAAEVKRLPHHQHVLDPAVERLHVQDERMHGVHKRVEGEHVAIAQRRVTLLRQPLGEGGDKLALLLARDGLVDGLQQGQVHIRAREAHP